MTILKFTISKWPGFCLELLTQLMLVIAILILGVICWPHGILDAPLAQIPLIAAIAAATSLFTSALGLSCLHFGVVELYSRSFEQRRVVSEGRCRRTFPP